MKTMHNRIRKIVLGTALCATAILGWTTQSQAAIISFDINGYNSGSDPFPITYSGAASIGTVGDFWNNVVVNNNTVSSFTATSLKLVDGVTVTPVSFFVSTPTGNLNADSVAGVSFQATNDLLNNYIFATSSALTFTLSGLVANSTYDLYLYGSAAGGAKGVFTVGVTTITSNTGWAPTGTNAAIIYPSTAAFTSITSNGSGVITGTVYNAGDATAFNGFQISGAVVPEPTTWAMLAIGLTTVMALRRRRSRA